MRKIHARGLVATVATVGLLLIWGLLAVVVFVSQRADGASWSLIMAGAQAVLTTLIFTLALRFGDNPADEKFLRIAGGSECLHDPMLALCRR